MKASIFHENFCLFLPIVYNGSFSERQKTSRHGLITRLFLLTGCIKSDHLRTRRLTNEDWENFVKAAGTLSESNIYIDDTPAINISEIREKSKRMISENYYLDLIVIDYLQLTFLKGKEIDLFETLKELRALSKKLEIPIIILSQVSRNVELREDKRPLLGDIRGLDTCNIPVDTVIFLYQEDDDFLNVTIGREMIKLEFDKACNKIYEKEEIDI